LVKESTEYDNFLRPGAGKLDQYTNSLDRFFDEPIEVPLIDNTKSKMGQTIDHDLYKKIYLHFRTAEDYADFCCRLGEVISLDLKEIVYPLESSLIETARETPLNKDEVVAFLNKSRKTNKSYSIKRPVIQPWMFHWRNMPEYHQEKPDQYHTLFVAFRSEKDMSDFANLLDQEITEKTKSIWHPELDSEKIYKYRWVQKLEDFSLPKYPVYIVSKGRYESMLTSKSLTRMKISHYIVIEPQEEDLYEKALDNFNLRGYVTLLIAPFSNHGDGPGRARNWAWDHSMSIGATSHWVLDDNISDFYRLNRNKRIRFESGVGFRVMEDFVDRYDNVYISGPQYRFFMPSDSQKPPYMINTRIYSTLLIRNDCKHRWRGRYNEDTDICLRVLKDGDCTVQFHAFLQGKNATQTVKGGNTAEFYHKEHGDNKDKWTDTHLNPDGTINKSKMLVDMHPDVTTLVWRYRRWHHHVNYESFKGNMLKPKMDLLEIPDVVNEYGMYLIDNYGE
jgi:hypothetical protein